MTYFPYDAAQLSGLDGRCSGHAVWRHAAQATRLETSVPRRSHVDQPACTASGTSISRLRILPVAVFGSSSANQILRGYL